MVRRPEWSVSVRCLNLARLEADLQTVESAGCDSLYVDVRDGRFVPGFGLGFETLAAVKSSSKLPCHVHLMLENPDRYVARFAEAGCASLMVQAETCPHTPRTLALIREYGMAAGIAIQPATPLTKLEYILPYADRVLLMIREAVAESGDTPGIAFERLRILRENLDYQERTVLLQVQGGIGAPDAARLIESGADIVVLDAPEIFQGDGLGENLAAYMDAVEQARKTA